MAVTPGYSGLLNAAFPRIGQYEAATGRRIRAPFIQGLLQADLDKAKQFAMEQDVRNRQLELQQQQMDIQNQQIAAQNKAGLIGGIGQLTQLPLAYMATKNLLGLGSKGAGAQAAVAHTAAAGLPAQAAAVGAPMAGAAPYSAAPLTYGAAGDFGGGLGAASTASTAPGIAGPLMNAAGPAAALFSAQYLTGKALQPTLDQAGFSNAGKGWTYGGLPGAIAGGSIDVGKKVFNEAKDFFSKIF